MLGDGLTANQRYELKFIDKEKADDPDAIVAHLSAGVGERGSAQVSFSRARLDTLLRQAAQLALLQARWHRQHSKPSMLRRVRLALGLDLSPGATGARSPPAPFPAVHVAIGLRRAFVVACGTAFAVGFAVLAGDAERDCRPSYWGWVQVQPSDIMETGCAIGWGAVAAVRSGLLTGLFAAATGAAHGAILWIWRGFRIGKTG